VGIAELAAMLERKTDSIRNWIENGVVPDAPQRTAGKQYTSGLGTTTTTSRRLWPAAEAAELVKIAAQEHILSKPRRPISTTDFSLRAWEARTRQQTWDD
jgi:hypothetical protein